MESIKKNHPFVPVGLVIAVVLCLIIILKLIIIVCDDRMWLKGNQNTIVNQFERVDTVDKKHQEELKARDKIIKLREGDVSRLESELKIAKDARDRADAAHMEDHFRH